MYFFSFFPSPKSTVSYELDLFLNQRMVLETNLWVGYVFHLKKKNQIASMLTSAKVF